MKKSISLFICILILNPLYAQTKSRGLSAVGTIISLRNEETKVISKLITKDNQRVLDCAISYSDPSGDKLLSEGEKGTVRIRVQNNSSEKQMQPKLKIQLQTSWEKSSRSSVIFMDPINPGLTGEYISAMQWDKKLPAGSIAYEVTAIDTKTNIQSKTVKVHFNIAGSGSGQAEPVFVDVDISIPRVNASNNKGIAVVIGNMEYTHNDIPNVDYAINDANTMKNYLINMLGYHEENIIYIENAQKADFESIFGTQTEHKGKLYNYIKPNQSEVFVYYSGHGAPDLSNKKAYFIPSNSDPNYVRIYGYPVEQLYKNLEKIQAKSITVVLDACFSGGSQQGMLIKNASPMYIDVNMPLFSRKINLLTSAAGDQISSWYPKANHSLFTYYLMRAIRGEADSNKNREITFKEVNEYLKDHVPYMARRMYGREQMPGFKGDIQKVISTY